MSFAQRRLNVTFRLGAGSFSSGGDTVRLPDGLRIRADVVVAADTAMTELKLQVFGMPLELMQRLTVLGGGGQPIVAGQDNSVLVEASSSDAPTPSTVFIGTINQAWANLNAPPDGVFEVSALTGPLDGLRPVAPTSYSGPVNVATAIQSLASQLGYLFENNGVDVVINRPYLAGTARDQIQSLVDAANINWILDGATVAIWPRDGSRTGDPILVGPENGLVGYPIWTQGGIVVRTLYNPNVRFGGRFRVESSIKAASGVWTSYRLSHELDSELSDGRWFSIMEGFFSTHEGGTSVG